jgi:hypothetical protein
MDGYVVLPTMKRIYVFMIAILLLGCGKDKLPKSPIADSVAKPLPKVIQKEPHSPLPAISIWDAARVGAIDTVRELVESGVNLNVADVRDPLQPTPLHCAVQSLHKSIVEILVMNGAEINLKRTDGLTALDIVHKNDSVRDIESRDLRRSIAAILVRNGATAAKHK